MFLWDVTLLFDVMKRSSQTAIFATFTILYFLPFLENIGAEWTNEQQKCMLLISLFLVDETLECTTNNENRLNNFNSHILFPSSKLPILCRNKHKSYSCDFPLPEKKQQNILFYFTCTLKLKHFWRNFSSISFYISNALHIKSDRARLFSHIWHKR